MGIQVRVILLSGLAGRDVDALVSHVNAKRLRCLRTAGLKGARSK